MKKAYYLGKIKSRNGDRDKIYFDIKSNKFICIKLDGEKRELTEKQKELLYNRYISKIIYRMIKDSFIRIVNGMILSGMFLILAEYNRIIPDIKELYIGLEKEENPDFLQQKTYEYINKNPNLSPEQKRYIIETIYGYINDYGKELTFINAVDMLNNISGVDVQYKWENNHNWGGTYVASSNIITLYGEAKNETLFHEIIHATTRKIFKNNAIYEGFDGAVCGKYCDELTYKKENEYLLLISEIIGKDNLVNYILNKEENKIIEDICLKTGVEKKEIKDLFDKMEDYNHAYCYNTLSLEELEKLDIKIKQELALLAIKASEENTHNFIVISALNNTFILKNSFLEDKYIYQSSDGVKIYVDNTNKFDIIRKDYEFKLKLKKENTTYLKNNKNDE